ncbi:MAG: Rho termination factor N-terminal domain-containing protein, partial [Thermomicrobia bacterium]|nr:Rho termination factor N-terminal domain-containing protein [Thermomicrobia bacterium]
MNDDMQGTTLVDERPETAETATPPVPEKIDRRRRPRAPKIQEAAAPVKSPAQAETTAAAPRRRARAAAPVEPSASIDDTPEPDAPLQAHLPDAATTTSANGADGAAAPHVVSDREMFGSAGLMTTTEPPEMPEPPAALAPAREVHPRPPQQYVRPPREEQRPQRSQSGQPYARPPRDDQRQNTTMRPERGGMQGRQNQQGQNGNRTNQQSRTTDRGNERRSGSEYRASGRDYTNINGASSRSYETVRSPAFAIEPATAPNSNDLTVADFDAKSQEELLEMASDWSLANPTRLRRQDLIYRLLQAQTEQQGNIFGSGVLDIVEDGYGFLRQERFLP